MTLVKFNRKPIEIDFNNVFEGFFNDMPALFKNDMNQSNWKGFVPVNITETGKGYHLEVVAPGYEKTDFKISLDQDILTISAEKKEGSKDDAGSNQDEKQIRKEYANQSFKRSFTLDEKIDGAIIEANYVNGILTLNLPKKETVKASVKEITIK